MPPQEPSSSPLDGAVRGALDGHGKIDEGERKPDGDVTSPEKGPASMSVMEGTSSEAAPKNQSEAACGPLEGTAGLEIVNTHKKPEESEDGLQASTASLSLSPGMQTTATGTHAGQELSRDEQKDAPNPTELKPDEGYSDPTPRTPRLGVSPVRDASTSAKVAGEGNPDREIRSIMDQFGNADGVEPDKNSWAEPTMMLSAPVEHPPRRSSLASTDVSKAAAGADESSRTMTVNADEHVETFPAPATEVIRPNRNSSLPQVARVGAILDAVPPSPGSPMSLSKAPLPVPDPEPDLPFDFHRFLEQLRDKSADPVAKYLRSFLSEFGRKQWMVHEQVKLVNDFLSFITNKMARCAVWRDVNDAEFDNAKEGMEKLVMNRLYAQTFSPAIPLPASAPMSRGKKKTLDKTTEPGRRGQHQEDIERDEILGQKVRIYGWIQEEHLDIPRVGDNGRRFLVLAQQELLKIRNYRAPRDKVICVLNCCKVIFGTLKNSKGSDTSADSFVPLLIYVVLHANPDHLVSNVQYILRFRNQDKLGGEAGYYLSSLMGAIQFIENLDRTSLTVSDQDFEKNVEAAVSAIAERHQEEIPRLATTPRPQPPRAPTAGHLSEKSGPSMPEVMSRTSIDPEYSTPRKSPLLAARPGDHGDDGLEDNTAVGGLLRTIQKPLSSIGRIFADDVGPQATAANVRPSPESQLPHQRLNPEVFQPPPRRSEDVDGPAEGPQSLHKASRPPAVPAKSAAGESRAGKFSAEDAAARQASAEAAEAQRIQRAEHHSVVETLAGMFPDLDRDVIDDVVRQKQGRVGLAVDACLALNN